MKYLDEDIRALFNGKSTNDEWIQKGDAFMSKRQYSNAKHCYGKGGDTLKEQNASAAYFEQEGDRLTATDTKTSREFYLQSSELFRGLNKMSDAIRLYEKVGEYEQVAWIYESMNRWYDAGVYYEKVKVPKLEKASMVYWKCYAIPDALRCAYACHEYTTAIEELRRIPQSLQPADYCKLITECARKGALYFHRKKQLQEMMSCILSFPSTDSKRDFLKLYVTIYCGYC
jgi:tetratricopeptide (TPR) repeat protein